MKSVVNEEYSPRIKKTTTSIEAGVIDDYINTLKSMSSVESIYMRCDFTLPGKITICIYVIADNEVEYIQRLRDVTLNKLALYNRQKECTYNYQLIVYKLNDILNMRDSYERNVFRTDLSNFYTEFLLDRRGYFMKLRNEILEKVGPLGILNPYDLIGGLETEKEAPITFNRKIKPRSEEQS